MRGKTVFTQKEGIEIESLLKQKDSADSAIQKAIRQKIRNIGFYAEDNGIEKGYYDLDTFKKTMHLIDRNRVFWHMQMNQPWGRNGGDIDSKELLNENVPLIATGEWPDDQCYKFIGSVPNSLKIRDIVLVREGAQPIALCEVISDSFKDSELTKKYVHENFRKVAVLDCDKSHLHCGLMFADLILDKKLNKDIGKSILVQLGFKVNNNEER